MGLSLILTIAAVVLFVLAAFGVALAGVALVPAGLACYALGRIVP